jgi:hypothetical protein
MHRPACLALALAACRPAPALDLPICPALVTAARAVEADSRVLPPDLWFRLLIADFDRNTGPRSGRPSRLQPASAAHRR